ncbi:4-alpha-glucanotransferase [Roseibium sp. MMSF_3412]|uniref:4-alpha-glucanotransferase n=1 Tax=Roseibium sp. MMSF_3412 TaxID=3046712 RepID=UPI00273D4283|nr:4-alpha-glucanotransferase [Roseibium sp. MMSF_3412]
MSGSALHELAQLCGVLPAFHDLQGNEHRTSDDTRRAMLRAMRIEAGTESDAEHALELLKSEQAAHIVSPEFVVTAGHGVLIPVRKACDWSLCTEDGQVIVQGFAEHHVDLPALEVGVYQLTVTSGEHRQTALVPAVPRQTPSLASRFGRERAWGVTAALYGLKSERNLGLGDYADLANLARTLGEKGAGFLGINPIHDWGWSTTDIASPYSPSHRGFLNTLHIAADAIPGLADNPNAAILVGRVRDTVDRGARSVDYQQFRARLQPLLRDLFALFTQDADEGSRARFRDFVQAGGDDLHLFATYETLAVTHGETWQLWPDAIRNPKTGTQSTADPREIDFHMWLQWVANVQLERISSAHAMPLGLYLDLAVGARRDGAEAWMGQDSLAAGVSLGAPPDHLSPEGQNWQLAAFAPSLSAKTHHHNLRSVLRQSMRSAGIIRIDHVLGLNRSFWIPDDGSPGAYIQQPFETLLALVGIEAHYADCLVVGEDLGLVPDGFRDALSARGLYSYSVLQYEKEADGSFRDPAHLRPHSLACFATHDTPTLYGYCAGRDIDWWQRLGWVDAGGAGQLREERRSSVAALVPDGAEPGTAIHNRLAHAPVAMASVQLDDILKEEEAQNLPGTIDEHSNWRRIYDASLETLGAVPELNDTAGLMQAAGRANIYPDGDD